MAKQDDCSWGEWGLRRLEHRPECSCTLVVLCAEGVNWSSTRDGGTEPIEQGSPTGCSYRWLYAIAYDIDIIT